MFWHFLSAHTSKSVQTRSRLKPTSPAAEGSADVRRGEAIEQIEIGRLIPVSPLFWRKKWPSTSRRGNGSVTCRGPPPRRQGMRIQARQKVAPWQRYAAWFPYRCIAP